MENIKEIFVKDTKLKIKKRYNHKGYYECSGASYKTICEKIERFNNDNNTTIYAIDDTIKDVTTIYFGE